MGLQAKGRLGSSRKSLQEPGERHRTGSPSELPEGPPPPGLWPLTSFLTCERRRFCGPRPGSLWSCVLEALRPSYASLPCPSPLPRRPPIRLGAWTEQSTASWSRNQIASPSWPARLAPAWWPGQGGTSSSAPREACDAVAETGPTQGDLLMIDQALASIIHAEHLGTGSKHMGPGFSLLPPPLPLKTFVKSVPGRATERRGIGEGRGAQRPRGPASLPAKGAQRRPLGGP